MKKPHWLFPDLPPFLAGLDPDLPERLRELVMRHGMKLGRSKDAEIFCIKTREPEQMILVSDGPPEAPRLLVLDVDETVHYDHVTIVIERDGKRIELTWSPRVSLEAVLLVIDTDTVIKTSQLKKSREDGPN